MKIAIVFLIILLFVTVPKWIGAQNVSIAKQRFDAKKTIGIDVRTKEEFKSNGADNSLNMPVDELESLIAKSDIAQDAMIFLFCRSGARSQRAKQILEKMGYKDVTNIGTYKDWVNISTTP
ncbi:MAG: rhodanese-like domain-containing protein [Deltaproteobacteria bacterium]|nr:rhodanese-like domain-containing protein [Deltaproteobacteria bacterium]